jgi:translation initiation factor 5B
MPALRQPIVCVLGHVDHGKTSLLDAIRHTKVQSREAGAITQGIGASEIPISVVKEVCAPVLSRLAIQFTIPGILTVDTPGHEAFTNLRRRGGSIADIAILVIDVTKGVERQTEEALDILREYKTPFVVALNKIDAVSGWNPQPGSSFIETEKAQQERTKALLDQRLYEVVGQLYSHNISAERFDRVAEFTKQVLIIPVSAKTSEGIPELLLYVSGLAQKFLEKRLTIQEGAGGKANILEVREEKGLGKTLDAILFDGTISEGDTLVFASAEGAVQSKAKAILKPKPLDEMRDPKEKFSSIPSASAAVGLKVACEGADVAVAGSSITIINPSDSEHDAKVAAAKAAIENEIRELVTATQNDGIILKADAFGSLEAIEKLLSGEKIVIRATGIGPVSKKEVLEAASVRAKNPDLGVIFAFNVPSDPDVAALSDSEGVKIFSSSIIYTIVDDYWRWVEERKAAAKREAFASLVMPARIFVMPGCCFRESNPAVFGIEVEAGLLKKDAPLMNEQGALVGAVRGIQKDKEPVESAKKGEQVAISISGIYYGRQVKEKMRLYTSPPAEDIATLEGKYKQALSEDEREVLAQIKSTKAAAQGPK